MWNSGLSRKNRAVADFQVSSCAHLSREDAAIAHFCGSSKADLTAQQRIFTDFRGMAHLHQVVDLRAAPDSGLADRRAVDCAMRLNFHVVGDHRDSRLAYLVPAPIGLAGKAEAVASDDGAILQEYAAADAAMFADAGMRVREKIVANCRAAINRDKAVKHGVAPDLDVVSNIAVRAKVCPSADFRGLCDHAGGVDLRFVNGGGMEYLDRPGKVQVWVGGSQGRHRHRSGIARDQNRGRGRRSEQRTILAICEERERARLRFLDSGNARDFKIRVAF